MSESQQKLLDNINDIIDEFNTIMLVSTNSANELHSRPMAIARHDEETGVLYFSTSVDTGKVEEIEQHPHVNINMQSSSQFVSLSGEAIVSNDRDLIADMYNASWKAWYPDGPEQKDIRLIKFNPEQAEYWNLAGLKGLKFLWEAGKAIAQDEQVDFDDPATHSKVDM